MSIKNIEIFTSNSKYENGECVGGYHEIHKINFLSSVEHLIATIDSIIRNNLLYGTEDTVLESVMVNCLDENLAKELNKHYKGEYGAIKVQVGL